MLHLLTWLRYRVCVDHAEMHRLRRAVGLCADCEHAQRVQSSHQSTFYLCQRSTVDPSFRKYPVLPVIECAGYNRREPDASA